MILQDVKTDFHTNGWLAEKLPSNSLRRYLTSALGEKPLQLEEVIDLTYSHEENRAFFLVNYWLSKYSRLIEQGLGELEKKGYELDDCNKSSFIGIKKQESNFWTYLCNGWELLTDEGHILSLGSDYVPKYQFPENNFKGPKLESKLEEAKDNDSLIIPAHPLITFNGLSGFYLSRVIKDPSGFSLGLNRENLIKFRDYFDALESQSLIISSKNHQEINDLAEKLDLPVISSSDGNIDEVFSYSNILDWIDFSSPENMRSSIRDGLSNKGNKIHLFKKNSPNHILTPSNIKHAFMPLIIPRDCY